MLRRSRMTDDRRKRFPLGSPHSQDLWHLFSPFCLCTPIPQFD